MATETRDFHAWVGRRERRQFVERVFDLCRALNVECTARARRGYLRLNLVFYVCGEPPQLDAFGEQYGELLAVRIDELMADSKERRTRTHSAKRKRV